MILINKKINILIAVLLFFMSVSGCARHSGSRAGEERCRCFHVEEKKGALGKNCEEGHLAGAGEEEHLAGAGEKGHLAKLLDNILAVKSLGSYGVAGHVWGHLKGWESLKKNGRERSNYATYSYVIAGRNSCDKYIELVNRIKDSTGAADEMDKLKLMDHEELNIFLIPAIHTDGSAYKPDYETSKNILAAVDAKSKPNFHDPGPYIITMYQPISSLQKGDAVTDMLYVDLTNISKGAIAEVVRVYKQAVLNKRLNGTDKLYSLRLALLNLAFMTEESIGFAKTASASLDPVFSGSKK